MQKESLLFFSFPRRSNFSEAKVTKMSDNECHFVTEISQILCKPNAQSSLLELCRGAAKIIKIFSNLSK